MFGSQNGNMSAESSKLNENDGFENFFNNESLSDRVLCICEVQEVECYLIESGVKRKRIEDDSNIYPFITDIKQEEEDEVIEGQGTSSTVHNVASLQKSVSTQANPIKVEENCNEVNVAVCTQDHEQKPQQIVHPSSDNSISISLVTPRKETEPSTSTENEPAISRENEPVTSSENQPIDSPQKAAMIAGIVKKLLSRSESNLENADSQEDGNGNRDTQGSTTGESQEPETTNQDLAVATPKIFIHVPLNTLVDEDSSITQEAFENENLNIAQEISTSQSSGGDVTLENDFEEMSGRSNRNKRKHTIAINRTYEKKILTETKVFVHSIILAAKSDFFKCLFSTSGMKETLEKEVKLEVRKGETETMLIMLRCFYNRNFVDEHTLDDVIKVISLAMQYCFDGLIDKCLSVFATHAEAISNVEDFNRINVMVLKIKNEFSQHKEKCSLVMDKCRPFLVNNFYPLDESLEKVKCSFFTLRLEAMNLFLDPNVQKCFQSPHGNLFVYAVQRWVRAHVVQLSDENDFSRQYKLDIIAFVEKFMDTVDMRDISSDFITNVMSFEISAFNIWPGYQEWYIKALQNFIYKASTERPAYHPHPVLTRERELHFARQEKNADIFSMYPVILNGYEIGIYLRVRDDRKVHMLCKCKNFQSNRSGFDKANLTFTLKGVLKLKTVAISNVWKEEFPRQVFKSSSYSSENFTFSYKQNTMCLQMYAVCKLRDNVYDIAKKNGFLMEFELRQLSP